MKVEDIMTKEVVSVDPKTKISEVAKMMIDHNFRGIPVVEDGALVGMITENDFLTRDFEKLHIPSLIKILEDLKISKYFPEKAGNLKEILSADASSIMSIDAVTIRPDEKVTNLIRLIQEKKVNPIPVVDENKKLLGIVSKADVLGLVGKFREEEVDFIAGEKK
ncbi:MAG: CBS domain-containing protein [Candidatus Moranbacteria bacterium]|nr:CBS domain-containing protein [Candidatus Moranbacteria bacterium]